MAQWVCFKFIVSIEMLLMTIRNIHNFSDILEAIPTVNHLIIVKPKTNVFFPSPQTHQQFNLKVKRFILVYLETRHVILRFKCV